MRAVAIVEAVELWRPQARIGGLRVEGASAFGSAGCLVGPALELIIRAQPAFTGLAGDEETFANCVADTVADGFRSWQAQWFEHWLAVRQVTQVMGQGPVPSLAPPAVLAGPVAGGTAQATGPCLV